MERVRQMSALVMFSDEKGALYIRMSLQRGPLTLYGITSISYSNDMIFIEQLNGQVMGINMNQIITYVVDKVDEDKLDEVLKNLEILKK